MNICIINDDMLPQHMGGIKRVLSILVKEWENECNIVIISVAPIGTRYDIFGKAKQRIFPNTKDILSCENIEYFKEVIQESNIDIILQPYIPFVTILHTIFSLKTNTFRGTIFETFKKGFHRI